MPTQTSKTIDGLCPWCKAPLPEGAVLCVQCGYHLKRGVKVAVDVEPTMAVVRDPANPYRSPARELGESEPRARISPLSFFSTSGRIPRWKYWLWLCVFVGNIVVSGNLMRAKLIPEGVMMLSFWGCLWLFLVAQIKRWHDLDRSGWCVLINLIPLGSLYTMVVLGFERGTDGPNEYGPDPYER
jgi:uncharacterized membrane protein YhaH (DUF805 family)